MACPHWDWKRICQDLSLAIKCERQSSKQHANKTRTNGKTNNASHRPLCHQCNNADTWRHMLEIRSVVEEHDYKGDDENEYKTIYRCVQCVAKDMNVPESAALSYIVEKKPGHQRRLDQNNKYNYAMKKHMAECPAMGKRKLCMLTRNTPATLMAPLVQHLTQKALALSRRSELLETHSTLVEQLRLCTDSAQSKALIEQIHDISDDIGGTEKPIAFATRVTEQMPHVEAESQEVQQWKYMLAAQYGDLWSEVLDKEGRRVGAFMTYYVCLAGGKSHTCGAVMDSKTWGRKHDDPIEIQAEVVLQLL